MPRFVLLRHECSSNYPRPSHWDLLLEAGDALKAWSLLEPPDASLAQSAEMLPDHRSMYLDYEGAVSGGRGSVTRWDDGTYELTSGAFEDAARSLFVLIRGKRLRGGYSLEPSGDGKFIFRSH